MYSNTYLNMNLNMDRKNSEKNIRKIQKMGKTSLGLTLPVEIISQLNWKEKQKVIVKKVRGGILIKDWKK